MTCCPYDLGWMLTKTLDQDPDTHCMYQWLNGGREGGVRHFLDIGGAISQKLQYGIHATLKA